MPILDDAYLARLEQTHSGQSDVVRLVHGQQGGERWGLAVRSAPGFDRRHRPYPATWIAVGVERRSMATDKGHKVEVMMHGERWWATEVGGKVTISRGGETIGRATLTEDHQFVGMTTTAVPDDVVLRLERELGKRIKEDQYKD